jgi:hypothetical protein
MTEDTFIMRANIARYEAMLMRDLRPQGRDGWRIQAGDRLLG